MASISLASIFHDVFFWTVPFILVLSVIVIVHELGHFLAARALGVVVETFSVGFGKEIAGFYDKRGTRWRLALLPLGGYVKFKGDENVASMQSREKLETLTPAQKAGNFHTAAVWRRALIVSAGPAANFALCIVLFTGWFMATGVAFREAKISCVEPGLPAAKAGLMAGDRVLAVSGTPIRTFDDLRRQIVLNARSEIDLKIDRGGEALSLRAIPELTQTDCIGRLGVSGPGFDEQRIETTSFSQAFDRSLAETWSDIESPFRFLKQIARGNACASQFGGPVKIAEISKDMATAGFVNLIPLIAFLSVSVGLFNLFPIPFLDGGHLLFYGAEAILGRPLNQKAQEIGFQIGFVLLVMLMVFLTWNNIADLTRGKQPPVAVQSVCRG